MADVYSSCGCGTKCGDAPNVRVVAGNDLTVEAVVSVWDAKECVYVPMDLTGASDVALNMVTTFTKVPGEGVSASGSRVSAFFPAGRLGKGVYGVEITFRDADGRGRAFERSLIEVVESSGEATVESTAEGETGDGLNITVDVRTRTVRIGGTGATDYPSLTGKPSINGVVLEGNKTSGDLGLVAKSELPTKTSQLQNDSDFITKTEAAVELYKKVDKVTGKGLSTNDYTDGDKARVGTLDKANADISALKTLTEGQTKSIKDLGTTKADKADVEPYDCTWAFRLSNGAEVTRDQVIELDTVISGGRPLYVINYKEHTSSVIGMMDDSSDNYSEIVLLMYTYSSGGLRCVISDLNMVDEGHYMEANISYWDFQQRLVSGANIKTINGVSVLGEGDIKTPAPTKVSELENDKGYYQKTEASLDHRVVSEALVSLAARLDALEGSRGLLGDATAGTVDVRGLTRCRYPLVMLGHGVPAEANVPVNLPDGLPWDGVPAFAGQQYINLDAASGGLYYAVGVNSVADWEQA